MNPYQDVTPRVSRLTGRRMPAVPTAADVETPPCRVDGGYLTANAPLAMVYAPMQTFDGLYTPEAALEHGTLFEKLDDPILTANGLRGDGQ